jgi:hypothetical protein
MIHSTQSAERALLQLPDLHEYPELQHVYPLLESVHELPKARQHVLPVAQVNAVPLGGVQQILSCVCLS